MKFLTTHKKVLRRSNLRFAGLTCAAFLSTVCLLPSGAFASTAVNSSGTNLQNGSTLTNGLVGYWTLDGKNTNWATGVTNDKSGQGNNGQLISMSTTTSPVVGKIGQALKFNGSSSYLSVPESSSLKPASAITISGWVKLNSLPADTELVSKPYRTSGWTSPFVSYQLMSTAGSTNKPRFALSISGSLDSLNANAALSVGVWYHLVGVYDGATQKIYINGALDSSRNQTGSIDYTGGPTNIDIGQRSETSSGEYVPGTIDDIHIYNRALSASEIKQLYNQGTATVNASGSKLNNGSSLTTGLVGYWPLDGATTNWATGVTSDKSGQGNNGQLISMSTTTSPVVGKMGQALKFNGSSSYLQLNDTSIFQPAAAITVSAWIKILSSGSGAFSVFDHESGSPFYGYDMYVNNNKINFEAFTAANTTVTGNTTLSANGWYHVVGVYDGSNLKVYVNGSSDATPVAKTGSILYTVSVNPTIGKRSTASTQFFPGPIDDVRIYNRALSATEIKQLYNQGAAAVNASGTKLQNGSSLTTGLVGYWPLDGATTNWATGVTTDKSGQGNNGSLVSMSTTTSPVAGKVGGALAFNGTTQYVNIADPASGALDFGSNSFSYSIWFKGSGLSAQLALNKSASNPAAGYDILMGAPSPGTVVGRVFDGTIARTSAIWSGTNDGKWHQVTFVVDRINNLLILYGDGLKIGTNTSITGLGSVSNSTNLNIGARVGANSFYQGNVDEVRIYNRTLSASEVKQLYLLGK